MKIFFISSIIMAFLLFTHEAFALPLQPQSAPTGKVTKTDLIVLNHIIATKNNGSNDKKDKHYCKHVLKNLKNSFITINYTYNYDLSKGKAIATSTLFPDKISLSPTGIKNKLTFMSNSVPEVNIKYGYKLKRIVFYVPNNAEIMFVNKKKNINCILKSSQKK